MKMYTVRIKCENDAFGDNDEDQLNFEVGRILKVLGQNVQDGGRELKVLRDHNGNDIGEAGFVGAERRKA